MERRGQKQAGHTQSEQTGAHLRYRAVVDLFPEPKASEEKGHAQNEKQVDENGADERRLHDADMVFGERDTVQLE